MPKKSKRAKAKFRHALSVQSKVDGGQSASVKNVRIEPQSQGTTIAYWQEQYKYIRPELIRICIIAGVFFVILIILSFILN